MPLRDVRLVGAITSTPLLVWLGRMEHSQRALYACYTLYDVAVACNFLCHASSAEEHRYVRIDMSIRLAQQLKESLFAQRYLSDYVAGNADPGRRTSSGFDNTEWVIGFLDHVTQSRNPAQTAGRWIAENRGSVCRQ